MKPKFRTAEMAKSLYQQGLKLKLKGATRDQLERASLSIYLNLVEGAAKPTPKDQRKFYFIAMGSLRETQAILDLVNANSELKLADQLGASLHCLIRALGSG
jgi:four helix bundle protein